MRSCVRFSFLALLVGVLVAVAAPGAQAAVGIEKFVATNCDVGFETCGEEILGPYGFPKEPNEAEALTQGYTQAGGHVPNGVTDFKITSTGTLPEAIPTGVVSHIRTDVAPGLATSPSSVPQCTEAEFGTTEAIPGSGLYPPIAPGCAAAEIGTNEVIVWVEAVKKTSR
jgi:hypothetical protein